MKTPAPVTERKYAVALGKLWVHKEGGYYVLREHPELLDNYVFAQGYLQDTGGQLFYWERVTTWTPSVGAVKAEEGTSA